jgi:YD repeat-containing protein
VGTGFDYGYDIMGRLRTATAPLGHTKSFNYDTRGLLSSFLDGTSETDYARTVLGQISLVTDANHNGWPRSYDPQGRLITAADPLGRTTMYEYDALSRPFHISRPDGSLIQIDYDASGRVTGESFGAMGPTLSYGYDDANRLTSATGASFVYDAAGRMTGSNGFGMTYDSDGRLLSETLAPGKAVSYAYESRGLLSQATDWMGGLTSLSYDAGRRLTGVTRPNGTHGTYAYDNANRLTSAVETNPGPTQISSIGIMRDALGQATSIQRRVPLMPAQTMASNASFTYDPASQVNGVAHDPLGRMTADVSRSFQWDGASRLMHYAAGADSPSFAYDAFGRMLSSSQGSQVATLGWNYGHNPPTNDDLQVTLPSRFDLCVRAPSGLLLYKVNGSTGARSFYHYDEAGNTAYLTNDAGSVVASYAYGPFGGVTGLGQTAGNPYTFRAAAGMMSLGSGSSGLWGAGQLTYDDRTMRGISGNTTHSGTAVAVGSQGDEILPDKHGRVKVQFFWDRDGKKERDDVTLNPQPFPPAPGDWVALNPQPFPPDPADWVALNPQPFPPSPGGDVQGPHPWPWVSDVQGPQPWPWVSAELNPQPFPPAPQGGGNPWDPGPGLFTPITIAELVLAMGPQRAARLGDGLSVFDPSPSLLFSCLAGDLGSSFYHGEWWGKEEQNCNGSQPIRIRPIPTSDSFDDAWEVSDVPKDRNGRNGVDLNCDGTLSSPLHPTAAPCVWCPR